MLCRSLRGMFTLALLAQSSEVLPAPESYPAFNKAGFACVKEMCLNTPLADIRGVNWIRANGMLGSRMSSNNVDPGSVMQSFAALANPCEDNIYLSGTYKSTSGYPTSVTFDPYIDSNGKFGFRVSSIQRTFFDKAPLLTDAQLEQLHAELADRYNEAMPVPKRPHTRLEPQFVWNNGPVGFVLKRRWDMDDSRAMADKVMHAPECSKPVSAD
jgi:hypothetical protein